MALIRLPDNIIEIKGHGRKKLLTRGHDSPIFSPENIVEINVSGRLRDEFTKKCEKTDNYRWSTGQKRNFPHLNTTQFPHFSVKPLKKKHTSATIELKNVKTVLSFNVARCP